jgi:hypothetical protein
MSFGKLKFPNKLYMCQLLNFTSLIIYSYLQCSLLYCSFIAWLLTSVTYIDLCLVNLLLGVKPQTQNCWKCRKLDAWGGEDCFRKIHWKKRRSQGTGATNVLFPFLIKIKSTTNRFVLTVCWFSFQGLDCCFNELRHQCFNVEHYHKIYHHYNFTVRMKEEPNSVDWVAALYFAEVPIFFSCHLWIRAIFSCLCCLIRP